MDKHVSRWPSSLNATCTENWHVHENKRSDRQKEPSEFLRLVFLQRGLLYAFVVCYYLQLSFFRWWCEWSPPPLPPHGCVPGGVVGLRANMSELIMISCVCFYFLQGVFLLSLCTSSSPFHMLWARPVSVESILHALKIDIPFCNTFSVLDPRTDRRGQWSPLWTENRQPPGGNCSRRKPPPLSTA